MSGRIIIKRVDQGPLWSIGSSYFSPALVKNAKAVPGMAFDGVSRTWRGYADALTAVVARLRVPTERAPRGIHCDGADDLPAPDSWRETRTPFLFSTTNLRDYQVEGVRFLIARAHEGALLADGMRLGKSAQSIIAARAFKQKTLVICPSHVVGVWGRSPTANEGPGEVAKWWPDTWSADKGVICLETVKPFKAQQVVTEFGSHATNTLSKVDEAKLQAAHDELVAFAEPLKNAQVIVSHFDIAYAWVHVLLHWGFGTLIVDEAHVLAGWQSRRSDAIKTLSRHARHRMFLTGTPVTNLPKNLHNVLDAMTENRFGYFFTGKRPGSYASVFCGSVQKQIGSGELQKTVWDHTGRSNLDAPDGKSAITKEETLHSRLKFLMLRRLKKDVDTQLPQKTRQIVDVRIPARNVISITGAMLGKGGMELRRCLDLAADAKLKPVVDVVVGHIAEEEKVIAFCYRRLFAERVAEDVGHRVADNVLVVFVHGGLTQKERDKRIHQLRVHDGPGVLACTIDTTSTGIDLSFATVAVVGELTWEPHELAQLEERLYAYGVGSKALIQYIIARGTGDELILRGIISKLDTFERVIGETGDRMKEELSRKREDGLKRLQAAIVEMQNTPVTGKVKKVRKKGGV